MNWNAIYCQALEGFLKRHNSKSVTGLSTSIGVSRRTIYKWKTEGRPGIDTFKRLMYCLGITGEAKLIFTISYMLECKNVRRLFSSLSDSCNLTLSDVENGNIYKINDLIKPSIFNLYGN
jgi:hypothetical protein